MSAPKRIQRKRTKGWRMPEGAVYVGRPTIFGNPFRAYKCPCCGYWDVKDDNDVTYLIDHRVTRLASTRADSRTWTTQRQANEKAVELYADEATYWLGGWKVTFPDKYAAVLDLRGRDLACWCPPDQPCHADVLLEVANS